MDIDQFARILSSIGTLKHKFIGSFPADMFPEIFPPTSFFISNTESSKRPGSHWVMVAKKVEMYILETRLGMIQCFVATQFESFHYSQGIESCRTIVWPILYFFRIFFFSNFRLYNVHDNFNLRFFAETF